MTEKQKKRDHGTGSITQMKNENWTARIQIGRQVNGNPKVKAFYGKTQAEVKRKLKDYIKEIHKNDSSVVRKNTVMEYMNNWLYNTKANSLKSSTLDRLEQTLAYQVYPYIGSLQMQSVTSADIQNMINLLINAELSFSTIKKAYDAVNACFKSALIKRDLMYNPVDGVELPTNMQKNTANIVFFNEDEIAKILNESKRTYDNGKPVYRLGYGIQFLLNTGLRIGEALALTWSEINLSGRFVTVRKTVKLVKNRQRDNEADNKYILKEQDSTKTKSGDRVVPLNKGAIEALKNLKKINGDKKYVFANSKRNIINPRNFDRMFRNILTQCVIDQCGVHSLRHTFASMLFKKGVDVKTVSEILGHSEVGITYDTYIHLLQEEKVKAIKMIEF